ncbi:hypothetical protein EV193_102211 [Herbihabitans rhizosphaerae]|uniref:Endonuclease/exonuclease/phosphatase domain-containing protein n=1 Tax=Herbihabitans rhizosphaerae TaxID=1872711 RepID=A0A4Q7L4T2_9PSEU|nr:hypothetical protein EV193_102211 [Herbihabitans rhizosphaerae]
MRRAQSSLDAGVKGLSSSPSPQPTPESVTLRTTWGGAPASSLRLTPTTTFGNTSGGTECLDAHHQARSALDGALKAFAATVDSDAERLEFSMAVYRKVDADAADSFLAISRNRLDVLTTHLSKPGPHAAEQSAQIDRLRGLAGDPTSGNTVVTGDFNAGSEGNGPSARGIREFGGQGFDVDAGNIHDGKHGTSEYNYRIDHVLPRGVGSSEATRWHRGKSDHDGQEVDVTLPYW